MRLILVLCGRHDCAETRVEPGHPRGLPGRRHGGPGQEEGQPQLLCLASTTTYAYLFITVISLRCQF
jgi:hypothetical protein